MAGNQQAGTQPAPECVVVNGVEFNCPVGEQCCIIGNSTATVFYGQCCRRPSSYREVFWIVGVVLTVTVLIYIVCRVMRQLSAKRRRRGVSERRSCPSGQRRTRQQSRSSSPVSRRRHESLLVCTQDWDHRQQQGRSLRTQTSVTSDTSTRMLLAPPPYHSLSGGSEAQVVHSIALPNSTATIADPSLPATVLSGALPKYSDSVQFPQEAPPEYCAVDSQPVTDGFRPQSPPPADNIPDTLVIQSPIDLDADGGGMTLQVV